jgi:hypothetical protein
MTRKTPWPDLMKHSGSRDGGERCSREYRVCLPNGDIWGTYETLDAAIEVAKALTESSPVYFGMLQIIDRRTMDVKARLKKGKMLPDPKVTTLKGKR